MRGAGLVYLPPTCQLGPLQSRDGCTGRLDL